MAVHDLPGTNAPGKPAGKPGGSQSGIHAWAGLREVLCRDSGHSPTHMVNDLDVAIGEQSIEPQPLQPSQLGPARMERKPLDDHYLTGGRAEVRQSKASH